MASFVCQMGVRKSSGSSIYQLCGCREGNRRCPRHFVVCASGGMCMWGPLCWPGILSNSVSNVQCNDKKKSIFISKMAWSSPVTHQFDAINLSSFSCDPGLLISPALYAAGWQRGCIATGVCVPTELQSSAEQHLADGWQLCWKISWLWDFERECSACEGLQAQYQRISLLRQLRKGYLKEMCWESDQEIGIFFTLSLHWYTHGG